MKKFITLCLIGLLFMTNTAYAYNEEETSIKMVNDVRRYYQDITSLTVDSALKEAAKNHSIYLNTYEKNNKEKVYTQDKENANFAGVYPWDRVASFNYDITKNPYTTELIYFSSEPAKQVFNYMINEPAYRVALLNPNYQHIGYYQENNKFVVELGGHRADTETVVYPFDEQKWVPYQYKNNDGVVTGYPITYTYYTSAEIEEIKLLKGSIIDGISGESVPYKVVTNEHDNLSNTLVLVPENPLEPNHPYKVNIRTNVVFAMGTEVPKTKEWSFNTGGRTSTYIYIAKDAKIKREEFASKLVRKANLDNMEPSTEEVMPYTDVPEQSLYKHDIMILKDLGIMQGYSETTFGYGEELTREEAVVLVMRLYNYKFNTDYTLYNNIRNAEFKDMEDVSSWAKQAVHVGYNLKVVNGYEDGYVRPKSLLNFKEAESLINQVMRYFGSTN